MIVGKPGFAVFRSHCFHAVKHARRCIAASKHELHIRSCNGCCTVCAVDVVDFLIRAAIRHHCVVREAMGEGNGVDERHDMRKEATIG